MYGINLDDAKFFEVFISEVLVPITGGLNNEEEDENKKGISSFYK